MTHGESCKPVGWAISTGRDMMRVRTTRMAADRHSAVPCRPHSAGPWNGKCECMHRKSCGARTSVRACKGTRVSVNRNICAYKALCALCYRARYFAAANTRPTLLYSFSCDPDFCSVLLNAFLHSVAWVSDLSTKTLLLKTHLKLKIEEPGRLFVLWRLCRYFFSC